MAVNELDFPNPATIGDASEYKVTPLYPLDVAISSSDHQSSATADGERESTFADKGESSVEWLQESLLSYNNIIVVMSR